MDKLYLKNVEIFANHGVFEEEKMLGQKFILDLEVSVDLKEAAVTGDLSKSINYGELCHEIERLFKEKTYDLIESAAERIADYILAEYSNAKAVKLMLKKPWAPIGRHLDYAAVEIQRSIHTAYLSIGSNMDGKDKNLTEAIEKINELNGVKVTKKSDFIITKPWGNLNQDDFLNAALEIKTTLSPKELIHELLNIENLMKRVRTEKWGPRVIDLDVIFYDDIISDDPEITLPHPLMEDREFVLKPLSQIAPNKVHPLLKKRVFRLLEDINK